MDRLVGYSGHDGFEQHYTLNAQGLRTSMEQQGSTNRRTLEEMLLGIELPESEEPEADGWTKTEYIWDVTLPYGQLLAETTEGSTTSYLYGLERISATNESRKTQYVYDMRGSVAQTLTAQDGVTSAKSLSYTPFGSPLDEQSRVTGFGYNAEYYDAATGMLNLRARQYEPAMNRFSQKDILKGSAWLPQSLNRYAFVMNDPVGLADPSGMFGQSLLSSFVDGVKDFAKTVVKTVVNKLKSVIDKAITTNANGLTPEAQSQFDQAQEKYKKHLADGTLTADMMSDLLKQMCSVFQDAEKAPGLSNENLSLDERLHTFSAQDQKLFDSYLLAPKDITDLQRARIVEHLRNTGGSIEPEDFLTYGLYSSKEEYEKHKRHADDAAALLEKEYRNIQSGTSFTEMEASRVNQMLAQQNALQALAWGNVGAAVTFGSALSSTTKNNTLSSQKQGTNSVKDSSNSGANTPLGSKANQMNQPKNPSYQAVRNRQTEIAGRGYSGHALDRMQDRGIMPSVVRNAIDYGISVQVSGEPQSITIR